MQRDCIAISKLFKVSSIASGISGRLKSFLGFSVGFIADKADSSPDMSESPGIEGTGNDVNAYITGLSKFSSSVIVTLGSKSGIDGFS